MWSWLQKHKKEGKFQVTNGLVPINPQVVKEFHPTTGYRKATCFFIGDHFQLSENKNNKKKNFTPSNTTQRILVSKIYTFGTTNQIFFKCKKRRKILTGYC